MTIISIDVSRREKEKKELKLKQKKLMDINLVEKTSENYKVVSNASNDKKMVGLLQKVRQSDTGVDEDFARFNGSHLYTQSIGKTQNKRKALLKENIDKSEKDYPTQLIGNKPRKRFFKKPVSPRIKRSLGTIFANNWDTNDLNRVRIHYSVGLEIHPPPI